MQGKKLVIVESPTKAKTIDRFLNNKDYIVESCMGHIRDLPESSKHIPKEYKKKPWSHLGVNVEEDFKPIYCIPESKQKIVQNLKSKMKGAKELILATDEDREGESISWHLLEILKPTIPVKRMVFHEITKEAIEKALKNFRDIDSRLVQAQEARRILDRLVGYTISPLLWKKIARGLSAGRVQSMAVKLISEREMERFNFKKASYWDIECQLKSKKESFSAQLLTWKNKKIARGKDFNDKGQLTDKTKIHLNQKEVKELVKKIKSKDFVVHSLETKSLSRSPKPPFITSTLQQEGHNKLHFSSRQTMSAAQKLYEKGFITYMRTDSTTLSKEAIQSVRKTIKTTYGAKEVPASARFYKTKSKGAQEAHEAIRPAGNPLCPPEKTGLKDIELKLYKLIWQRTLASQMNNCEQEQMNLILKNGDSEFISSGTRIVSAGFYKAYREDQKEVILPTLKKGDVVKEKKIEEKEHSTQAPARYNEASLIKKLEKEGIGRPSTYAPIISTIQDRGYVKKTQQALAPTFTALAVTQLLSEYLPNYVNLKFTSDMEKTLDDIADGKTNSTNYLNLIYKGKDGLENQVKNQEKNIDGKDSRTLKFKGFDGMDFHIGRFGAYIIRKDKDKEVKVSLPLDMFPSDLNLQKLEELFKIKENSKEKVGKDPKTKEDILIKTGPYGPYLELEKTKKRASIPTFLSPDSISLEQASQLLELPKTLGTHPETKNPVKKSIGRFGPYIVHDGDFRSIPADENFLSLDIKEALKILSQPKAKGRSSLKIIKELKHKEDSIKIIEGKYGVYIKFKAKNITLPKELDPKKITVKEALEIIAKKKTSRKKRKR